MKRDRIAGFLPETWQAAVRPTNPLGALLAAMEALHAPADRALDELDAYVDPMRAPDPFVVMLAQWLDLDRYLDWSGGRPGAGAPRFAGGAGRLRLLIDEAVELTRWRGTRRALERFLFVATGIAGVSVEENPPDTGGRPIPFHIRVRAPAAALHLRDLIERIVDQERPAYATYDIEFAPPPDAEKGP